MMNDTIQAMDIINSLKEMIADQAYQIAYRDAAIKVYEKQLAVLQAQLERVNQPTEANENAVEAE